MTNSATALYMAESELLDYVIGTILLTDFFYYYCLLSLLLLLLIGQVEQGLVLLEWGNLSSVSAHVHKIPHCHSVHTGQDSGSSDVPSLLQLFYDI